MMLTYDEQKKIERLATRDEEIRNMIATIKSDYHLTVSQISHEIRNPLTYINSSVQWIQKMHPEVEDFEFWSQIKNDLQYMRLLLDDISAFNNGDQLNICQIDLKAFACDLKDTLLAELLRCHIPLNLLKNSMESITGRGKITLKIYVHDKRLLIAVKDNGCGIPREQLQIIFQPFVTYKEHGTGLGLPIVRKIISAHGGTIRIYSEPEKGTEVQIYLPFLPSTHSCIY